MATVTIPKIENVTFTLKVEQDFSDFRGHFETDEGKPDAKLEREIAERLERGDVWAWADVSVTASFEGVEGLPDTLCGCCYESEAQFRADGYFEDMKTQAYRNLLSALVRQMSQYNMEQLIVGVTMAVWPSGDKDAEWSSDTASDVDSVLRHNGISPQE